MLPPCGVFNHNIFLKFPFQFPVPGSFAISWRTWTTASNQSCEHLRHQIRWLQKLASVHNRAATLFSEMLKRKPADRVSFHLIGNVLEHGRKYLQLRRPHLPPLYYTQRALIWRDGHDLQRGALSKLAAGRTGSRRRGGPGSDGAATAPGCGEDTEVLATLNPHDNEVVHLTDAEHAAFVDCCAAGAHQIPQGT